MKILNCLVMIVEEHHHVATSPDHEVDVEEILDEHGTLKYC